MWEVGSREAMYLYVWRNTEYHSPSCFCLGKAIYKVVQIWPGLICM